MGAVRLFVSPDSVSGSAILLEGDDAARAHDHGARPGGTLVLLDGSGWEVTAEIHASSRERCVGRVAARRLADERRTKVTLYQGLLPGADFRRLLARATRLGAVGIAPVVTDASPLADLPADALSGTPTEWLELVRDVAETGGRGRCPAVRPPMLLDRALDEAAFAGTVLIVGPIGPSIPTVLGDRPFSVALFCPSPGGFSAAELTRAGARGAVLVGAPVGGPDPVRLPAAALEATYDALEPDDG